MAARRTPARTATNNAAALRPRRPRKERKFPALTFEEALTLPEAIQKYASGQKVRRLTLFERMNKNPDNLEARKLITASGQYGLTRGSYTAEHLELTPEGHEATSDDTSPAGRLGGRFKLAIGNLGPFNFLYQRLKGGKMPAKEVMADYLSEANVEDDEKAECIDTFILNAKFLGLLRMIGGAERLVPIEQALEEAPTEPQKIDQTASSTGTASPATAPLSVPVDRTEQNVDFGKICFYITPIGDDNSEERRHADFLMEYIIKPAVKEFGLTVVRADQMGKSGMIGKQVIEHILHACLVIADLSFHNPNVFYELCLRHTTRLPTVQVRRAVDKIPFDLNQYRTIPIETRDPYSLVPKIQTYTD